MANQTPQIITGHPPFGEHKMEVTVIYKVTNGIRPMRPTQVWCPDKIWDLIESCWAQDGRNRPPASSIPQFLKGVARDLAHASIPAGPLLKLTRKPHLKPKQSALFLHSPYDGGSVCPFIPCLCVDLLVTVKEYTSSGQFSRSSTSTPSTDDEHPQEITSNSLLRSLQQQPPMQATEQRHINSRTQRASDTQAPLIVVSPSTSSDATILLP